VSLVAQRNKDLIRELRKDTVVRLLEFRRARDLARMRDLVGQLQTLPPGMLKRKLNLTVQAEPPTIVLWTRPTRERITKFSDIVWCNGLHGRINALLNVVHFGTYFNLPPKPKQGGQARAHRDSFRDSPLFESKLAMVIIGYACDPRE
jgi:hypothetical protein